MKRTIACAILALIIVVAAQAQKPPAIELGFKPDRVYDFNAIDSVNAFNGNVVVTIPIGMRYPAGGGLDYSLTLVYNSKVWDYKYMGNGAGQWFPWSVPNLRSNAGTGWRISMGRLLAPTDPTSTAYREDIHDWIYEGPSGDEHAFSDIVFNGAPPANKDATVQFTADGSYLRMTLNSAAAERVIEFPDGKKHTFSYKTEDGKWHLTKIADRFGNEVDITYDFTDGRITNWWITDSAAPDTERKHQVHFVYLRELEDSADKGMNVKFINLQGVTTGLATHATYTFNYYTPQVVPSCYNDYWGEPGHQFSTMAVPFLGEIVLPDDPSANDPSADHAASYHFSYFETDTLNPNTCRQGLLSSITLPTRGSIAYEYQLYTLPDQDACKASGPRSSSPGVKTRTLNDGGSSSTWTYALTLGPEADVTYHQPNTSVCTETKYPDDRNGDPQWPRRWSRTSIISPPYATAAASRTDHYFDVYVGLGVLYDDTRLHADTLGGYFGRPSVIGWPGQDVAKLTPPAEEPETHLDQAANDTTTDSRYLSEQVWGDCSPAGDCSSGALLRSTFRRFVEWIGPGSERQLVSERTVAHDDEITSAPTYAQCVAGSGCRYVQTDLSDFDGVGHLRTRTTTNNYPAVDGTTIDSEVTYTGYPTFTSAQLNALTNWVFTKYDRQSRTITTTHDSTQYSETSTRDFCFDIDGQLTRTRSRAGTNAGEHDVITTYTFTEGNLTDEKTYGGDTQTLGTGSICDATLPAAPRYWNQYTYLNGRVATGTFMPRANEPDIDFKTIDYDPLPGTGLVTTSRGPDGLATTYGYQVWGALKSLTLPGETAATYTYAPATESTNATVTMAKSDIGMVYEYDGLGRLRRTARTLPGAGCVEQVIGYDAFGRHAQDSVWKACGGGGLVTGFKYDALGRTTEVTAPDSSITTITYQGDRIKSRSSTISGVSVKTTEQRDALGRLAAVTENDETTSEALTTYTYDVADRLVGVNMDRAGEGIQTRTFSYDGRGFLTEEKHPELGASGDGTITYADYDARGHAQSRTVGSDLDVFDQLYTYDDAERLILVRSRVSKNSGQFHDAKSFNYLGPDDKAKGRLLSQTRHNYLATGDVTVAEEFAYSGTNGRLYEKTTSITDGSALLQKTRQRYTFDGLGELSTITYPWCNPDGVPSLPGCGIPGWSTLVPTYQNGLVRSIIALNHGSFVNQVDYLPTGAWGTIDHANGTVDQQTADHGMARPATISFSGLPDCTPTSILTQPASQTVPYNGRGSLHVSAGGTSPSFQWYQGTSGAGSPITGANGSSYETPPLTATTSYWVEVTNACGSAQSQTATVTVLGNPGNLVATKSGSVIWLTWAPAMNAGRYDIERRSSIYAPFTKIGEASVNAYDDSNLASGTAYQYRVRAVNGSTSSLYTNTDVATNLTLSTIAPGGEVLAAYVEELRAAVNAIRGFAGLAPLPWSGSVACSDSILGSGITPPATGSDILAAHLAMLRQCMNAALTNVGLPMPLYTDPSLPGVEIKAVHFTELQGRVQ